MPTNDWKIVIEVKPEEKGNRISIIVEPIDQFPDDVAMILQRAAAYYERQLAAMQNIQIAAQLQQDAQFRRSIKLT